jgi:hypothetical protein
MAVHDEFADLAQELIAENGRPLKVRKLSRTPADAAKPWRGPDPTQPDGYEFDVDAVGVVVDWTEQELDEDQTRRGSKRLLIAAKHHLTADTPVDLLTADSLLDEGGVYSLSKGSCLKPGTTAIMYDFQVRQ